MIIFNAIGQVLQSPGFRDAVYLFFSVLLDIVGYIYMGLRFFKLLCYSKMTFDWLPMINPYIWPFNIFRILTKPYFTWWARNLPSIKSTSSSIEVSAIIALEVLNSLIYFCVQFTGFVYPLLAYL
mgnify:CR=1 FL=1|jgi:hypothetical protein